MSIRVVIVDDQELIRSGLRAVLEAAGGITVVAEAHDGAEAVSEARKHMPDVVLMDLHMPRVDGVDATVQLLRVPEPPRVLVLTTFDTDDHVMRALAAGASGFVLKDVPAEEITAAVRTVASGGTALSAPIMAKLLGKARHTGPQFYHPGVREKLDALSASERNVLSLVGEGLTNQQIAAQLHLSVTSVKTYVSRVLARFDLDNRTQAALLSYEVGLVRWSGPGSGVQSDGA
ncbi:response regulator transcription factor [Streptomyces sp. NPDC089919]|uniref:response regulator transcription factor n=1 Tax=Streptomyces sp. NPDC089919 TaxID=3155188 RepID=UPI0034448893